MNEENSRKGTFGLNFKEIKKRLLKELKITKLKRHFAELNCR